LQDNKTAILEYVLGDEESFVFVLRREAGSPSTLLTQWEVEDAATADLMVTYYHRWLSPEGTQLATKARALQLAQLDLMKKQSHPYFWAPFVVIGDAR
jgi:CHAT domain-containing protein